FNRWFGRMTERYARSNDRLLARPLRAFAAFLVLVVVTVLLFFRLPTAFLPTEDQGFLITIVQAPPGSTRPRTEEAIEPVQAYWRDKEVVKNVVVLRGFNFFGRGQNNAMMFTTLTPWEERTAAGTDARSLLMEG